MSKTKVLFSMHSLVPCILIYGPRSGKMTKFPIFIFSTFSIVDIFYDQNDKITMSLTPSIMHIFLNRTDGQIENVCLK